MTSYRKLPDDLLIAFFQKINQNIEQGLLSELMKIELNLIYDVVVERNLEKPLLT
ncbi:hypothetical protein [Anaerobacillus alkaliphilus]|uniref:hypothetical protein n=1 Tax=Anaerobacillus alkaliphilus TaxID=1548597 RepID=UPI00137572A1|nr:hypothetical protein [Anaerobacillus alkaliphilus]